MQASDFDHRCTEPTCCVYGQPTTTSCLCHKSREDMMLAALVAEKRAREEATEDTRSLCRFILSEWGPDGALKATTYSLEQREARSAKGGDANDSGPSRPIDATSPGVTAGASAGEDGELCKRVDDTLQAMASQAFVPMGLWDKHSNGVLALIARIRALTAENEALSKAASPINFPFDFPKPI